MSPQGDLRLLFRAPAFRWRSLIWKEEDAEPRAARRPVRARRLPGLHGDVQRLCCAARGDSHGSVCVCPAWGWSQPARTAERGSTRPSLSERWRHTVWGPPTCPCAGVREAGQGGRTQMFPQTRAWSSAGSCSSSGAGKRGSGDCCGHVGHVLGRGPWWLLNRVFHNRGRWPGVQSRWGGEVCARGCPAVPAETGTRR